MKKNLKSCMEVIEVSDRQCLLDMNQYDMIERAGMIPDLRHKKSAHMTAGWSVGERAHAAFAMGGADLEGINYLTFSVFSVGCAGMRFRLLFDSSKDGSCRDGYEAILSVVRDGWNDYRVRLPFMHACGEPKGWGSIGSVCFDVVGGVSSLHEHPMLYIDNLFVWEEVAAPLYTTMPELKGAALFSKTGSYSIVDRKRISNALGEAQAVPFEQDGTLWLPIAPVAAGIARTTVVDNLAMTLSFTYRRKKYAFSANSDKFTVDGEEQKLGFFPKERGGTLFFPAEYVCNFFRWRQIYVSPYGLILLSNRKNAFVNGRDDEIIRRLMADMTYVRPSGERVLNDLRRRFNTSRGRLLASFDDLMKLRRTAKEDADLKELLNALKKQYGKGSASYDAAAVDSAQCTAEREPSAVLENGAQRLFALSMLYRATGDKEYCNRAYEQVQALASFEEWAGSSMAVLGSVSLSMAIAYDWCHHVWDEAQKALAERAMLRRGMRVGLALYQGKGRIFRLGGSVAAQVDAGMLSMALALADVYPETSLHLIDCVLPHAEACFDAYAPDGGYAESISAWEKTTRALVLFVAMLQKACGTDYGFASSAGFMATAYFPVFTETENGAWNYHNSTAQFSDTAVLNWFSAQSGDVLPAWLHFHRLQAQKEKVTPLDLLFYQPVEKDLEVSLPLDAVYRRTGLAVMRSDWGENATVLGLHAGSNRAMNADLDVGTFFLEMDGERFFGEIGGDERFSVVMRRRAEGQNTLIVAPALAPLPDQNPDADAVFTEMKGSEERAYAVVDMSTSNHRILRGKRGAMLCESRSIAVIQDELTLTEPCDLVWNAWTSATVERVGKGRALKLTQNGKTMLCRLCGVSALFEVERMEGTEWTRLSVKLSQKARVRMAVVCCMQGEDGSTRTSYDVVPMSTWDN